MYYVNTQYGFVERTKFTHATTGAAVFAPTPDVRAAHAFSSYADAFQYINDVCKYRGHYAIMRVVSRLDM